MKRKKLKYWSIYLPTIITIQLNQLSKMNQLTLTQQLRQFIEDRLETDDDEKAAADITTEIDRVVRPIYGSRDHDADIEKITNMLDEFDNDDVPDNIRHSIAEINGIYREEDPVSDEDGEDENEDMFSELYQDRHFWDNCL